MLYEQVPKTYLIIAEFECFVAPMIIVIILEIDTNIVAPEAIPLNTGNINPKDNWS